MKKKYKPKLAIGDVFTHKTDVGKFYWKIVGKNSTSYLLDCLHFLQQEAWPNAPHFEEFHEVDSQLSDDGDYKLILVTDPIMDGLERILEKL